VASVAVMVRIAVCATATDVGFAVIVTVGTFRILLPTKRAHPEQREQKTARKETSRGAESCRVVCSVCKVLSIFSRAYISKQQPEAPGKQHQSHGKLKTFARTSPNCRGRRLPARRHFPGRFMIHAGFYGQYLCRNMYQRLQINTSWMTCDRRQDAQLRNF